MGIRRRVSRDRVKGWSEMGLLVFYVGEVMVSNRDFKYKYIQSIRWNYNNDSISFARALPRICSGTAGLGLAAGLDLC